jgi:hypothetical protein
VPAALFDQLFHDRPGKTPAPVLIEDIHPVHFETVRVPGAARDTDQLRPGKRRKKPVRFYICLLLVVVNPEFFFSTDHFVRGEFPNIDGAGKRVGCRSVPRGKEVLLEPVDKMRAEGDKTPALFPGKCIEYKKCCIFSGGFCFYCCGLCWRMVIPPVCCDIDVVIRTEFRPSQ